MSSPSLQDSDRVFVRTVLDLAAQTDAAERDLKTAILTAARAGNSALVERLMSRWLVEPAAEILKDGLD